MRIPFSKMHGAGNDFVVIDHREPFLPAEAGPLFARLCDRRRGVGADGVLLLEADAQAPALDFAMRYHNADGGRAEFCGNGARCLARFALGRGLGDGTRVAFRTDAGAMRAEARPDGRIALAFGRVEEGEELSLAALGREFRGRRVVAGVPHFVVPVERVESVPLGDWAPALRSHTRLGVAGANVDFVAVRSDGRIAMRTWERGVEGETLACGSGAMATALWALLAGAAKSPVTIHTAGGDDLVVELNGAGGSRQAVLVGPAAEVFTGEWHERSV